ncbi:MAG: 16S rRNA (guanine(966)-N(2))-methyltransferase RsmD [Magnetococcales bacterium]|nr:16S rRNA (guanine(966)-N(2))-methyltransferase RsmD [Magnetococcales bacterium]
MVKISAGSCKGRALVTGKDQRIRPTTGRVKEALFSMLAPRIPQANVLDLFSGSGSLGLEALSRGAKTACFVDNHRESIALIEENIKRCGFSSQATVIRGSALQGKIYDIIAQQQRQNSSNNTGFNLVFLDPPYGKGMAQTAINHLIATDLLLADGVIVTEEANNVMVTLPDEWTLWQSRGYSDTRVNIWTRS